MFKQPFKEYFSFSASERNAILIISFLILLVVFYRITQPDNKNENTGSLEVTMLEFDEEVRTKKSRANVYNPGIIEENLSMFNPNTMTDSQWQNLGLRNYQIENISNYLAKVGKFRNKEDFKSLYTISDEEYERLEPFLIFEKKDVLTADVSPGTEETSIHHFIDKPSRAKSLNIELNRAEPGDLELLPGIGPVFSKRIKKYQQLLGGFVDVRQLNEVYGLDSTTVERIKPYLWIDTSAVKKLVVNQASTNELSKHPYLNHYEASGIVTFREYKKIDSLEELLHEKILPLETYNKIRHYLE